MLIYNKLSSDVFTNAFANGFNRGVALYTQKPAKRIIYYKNQFNYYKQQYFLSIPNHLFRIEYYYTKDNSFILKNALITFTDDYAKPKIAYMPAFTNIIIFTYQEGISEAGIAWSSSGTSSPDFHAYIHAYICMKNDPDKKYNSLNDLINQTIHEFWSQPFTYEGSLFQYTQKPILKTYETWHNHTKQNPNWIPTNNDMTELVPINDLMNTDPNIHLKTSIDKFFSNDYL